MQCKVKSSSFGKQQAPWIFPECLCFGDTVDITFFLKEYIYKKTNTSEQTSDLIIIQNFLLTSTSNEKRWQDEDILFSCSFYASSV